MPPRADPRNSRPRAQAGAPPASASSRTFTYLVPILGLLAFQIIKSIPWFSFYLTRPNLPPFFVPNPSGSIATGAEQCWNLRFAAADPYRRGSNPQDGFAYDAHTQFTSFCEDADMLHGAVHLDGWAMLACDPGRDRWNTVMGPLKDPAPRGALWMYNWQAAAEAGNSTAATPYILPLNGYPKRADFHPLGSTVHISHETGLTWLYVVNHGRQATTIEVFKLIRNADAIGDFTAQWQRSVAHPLATHSANAVVALSENQLLVTNDHFFTLRKQPQDKLPEMTAQLFGKTLGSVVAKLISLKYARLILPRLETLLGLPLSWVAVLDFDLDANQGVSADVDPLEAAYDGATGHMLIPAIAFANGIALAPNGKTLAVASTMSPGVELYSLSRNPADGRLAVDAETGSPVLPKELGSINLPLAVDNLAFSVSRSAEHNDDVFGGASLIAGGHPYSLKLLAMARDPHNPKKRAPSWVVKVDPAASGAATPAQDLPPDDAPLPASSRVIKASPGYAITTLYQGLGPIARLDETQADASTFQGEDAFVGIASSTGGSYHASVAGGTLLVPGLYAAPAGVMLCTGVERGLEMMRERRAASS